MRRDAADRRGFWLALGLGLAAFYVGAALLEGYRLYPDSESYLTMAFSREPLYGLFLALLRKVFGGLGEAGFLQAAAVVQSLLTAWAGLVFTRRVSELFKLEAPGALGIAACTLLPALFCRFFAARRAMYCYSILSESLAFPLYLVFFALLAAWMLRGRRGELLLAALCACLLISLRKQMLVTLPLLGVAALLRGVLRGQLWRRLAAGALAAALALGGSSLLDRGYNYVLRGEALRHAGDMRFVTTMLLYSAEPSDAEAIGDAELRGLFEQMRALADERQLTRAYAPADWFGRSLFFMNHYDLIQYGCLRDTLVPLAEAKCGADETAVGLELNRIYDGLNAALLPTGWTRLLATAADSFGMGLVNTVAAMKRPLIPVAAALYLGFLALLVRSVRRRREDEALFAALTLASVLGNLALVSLTIFCQPRYTLYNMPLFYVALLLMARGNNYEL